MKIITVDRISFTFPESELEVIKNATFSVNKGEFVSIVGPSGCGKSTLLRIIAGLIKPTGGHVLYYDKEIREPHKDISFVFQDFGLLPWLTNKENVKIGLSFLNISEEERDKRASELLDKFGLSGFDDYYPNTLSGGMKQRVGIARAVASNPQVLLMDEPFSSLDELTAESLRADIIYMLENKNLPVNSVIMVTHNVVEAVELSNRVVVLADKPSVIKHVENIKSKRPRDKRSKDFQRTVDDIYIALTK